MKTFSIHGCWICGKRISSNGWSTTAHYRAHARKGEIVEMIQYDYSAHRFNRRFCVPAQVKRYEKFGWERKQKGNVK